MLTTVSVQITETFVSRERTHTEHAEKHGLPTQKHFSFRNIPLYLLLILHIYNDPISLKKGFLSYGTLLKYCYDCSLTDLLFLTCLITRNSKQSSWCCSVQPQNLGFWNFFSLKGIAKEVTLFSAGDVVLSL